MEKKLYITPAVTTMAVSVENIIATSGPGISDKPADETAGQDTKSSGDWDIWE